MNVRSMCWVCPAAVGVKASEASVAMTMFVWAWKPSRQTRKCTELLPAIAASATASNTRVTSSPRIL